MYLIGLTGGIASGKSTVAARLVEHGAVLVDADRLAREVVSRGSVALNEIVQHFGPAVLRTDGALDRAALGAIVFNDPAELAALNAITHPAVWARATRLIADAAALATNAVVVYDVPLLVEASAERPMRFDLIAVVHAAAAERVRRLVELRGMTVAEAEARIRLQARDAERLAVADVAIDSSESLDSTLEQADSLWRTAVAFASRAAVPEHDASSDAPSANRSPVVGGAT